ncbi:hypothetical protein [Streptomyces sp. NPDC057496]
MRSFLSWPTAARAQRATKIYTGAPIPDGSWRDRMWLDTWI